MDSKDTQIEGLAVAMLKEQLAGYTAGFKEEFAALVQRPEILAHIPAVKALQEEVERLSGLSKEYFDKLNGWQEAYIKAERTLLLAGFTDQGGELWKPPLGPSPSPLLDRIATLEATNAAQAEQLAKSIHYPDCWDTMAYPTVESALHELQAWFQCSTEPCQSTPAESQATVELTDDDLAHQIACVLAEVDGYDPDDMNCGLYDLRWSGGSAPEPLGDAFSLEYLPKAYRICQELFSTPAKDLSDKSIHGIWCIDDGNIFAFARSVIKADRDLNKRQAAKAESQLAGGEAVAELWSGLNDCARELGYDFLRPEFAHASRALVKYAPNNLGVHTAAPAIKQQVAEDYLLIELGHGNIEIGDDHLEGVPAIVFGRNGNGRVGEQLTFTDREMAPGETIACITFANIAGLDVLQMKMDSLRSHMLAEAPTQPVSANQPDSGKVPPGYALVPIEPSPQMRQVSVAAWYQVSGSLDDCFTEVWKAMISAAPSAPIAEGDK